MTKITLALAMITALALGGCNDAAKQKAADEQLNARAAAAAQAELDADHQRFLTAATTPPPPVIESRPEITVDAGVQLLARARASLKDPDSGKFRGVKDGTFTDNNHESVQAICGWVNAKNSYGGYTGERGFVAWVKNGEFSFRQQSDAERDSDFAGWVGNQVWLNAGKQLGCI